MFPFDDVIMILNRDPVCCSYIYQFMVTSANGEFFRITGPLWLESIGHWWVTLKNVGEVELWCPLVLCLTSCSTNSRIFGCLGRLIAYVSSLQCNRLHIATDDDGIIRDKNCKNYCDVLMSAMASQITGVSIVCSSVCSGADQRKHQSSAPLAFVRESTGWAVDSPHKGPVTRKKFSFDSVRHVIWYTSHCGLAGLYGTIEHGQNPWDNDLSPGRCPASKWKNADLL